MSDRRSIFSVQPMDYRPGYAVMVTWPDGRAEQLVGAYVSREHAEQWIQCRSALWLESQTFQSRRAS
jgi:hypothetical protein